MTLVTRRLSRLLTAVNKPKNKIVSKEIADALHDASDHLPIVIEFLPYEETDPNFIIVYITKSGSKYHRGSCQYLSSSKIPITLADAIARGYMPCSVCKPPVLEK